MKDNVGENWLAVVNPHAGSGKTISEWTEAERFLQRKGVSYECRMTGGEFNASQVAYNAAVDGYRRFIAVGGDGTVHDVLDGMMKFVNGPSGNRCGAYISDFVLAVIPIGSGNDWIKSHDIPRDTEMVVDTIASESFAMQDIVKVSFMKSPDEDTCVRTSYMVNVGGVGFDACICDRVNRKKSEGESGKMLYVRSLLYNLFHYKPSGMRVECDGDVVYEGPCYSIAFGIGKYSGGGMRQTPDAVLDDGLLDVTVIPPFSIFRILREAYKLFNGKILTIRELVSRKVRKVKVTPLSDVAGPVEVDGENLGCLPMMMEVLPEKLRVLHLGSSGN